LEWLFVVSGKVGAEVRDAALGTVTIGQGAFKARGDKECA